MFGSDHWQIFYKGVWCLEWVRGLMLGISFVCFKSCFVCFGAIASWIPWNIAGWTICVHTYRSAFETPWAKNAEKENQAVNKIDCLCTEWNLVSWNETCACLFEAVFVCFFVSRFVLFVTVNSSVKPPPRDNLEVNLMMFSSLLSTSPPLSQNSVIEQTCPEPYGWSISIWEKEKDRIQILNYPNVWISHALTSSLF